MRHTYIYGLFFNSIKRQERHVGCIVIKFDGGMVEISGACIILFVFSIFILCRVHGYGNGSQTLLPGVLLYQCKKLILLLSHGAAFFPNGIDSTLYY